jgi:putative acetyltransferase
MNQIFSIRGVMKQDEPCLGAIIKAVFEEHDAPRQGTVYSDPTTDHLFDLFTKNGSLLWVAEWNHQVVGCCGIYPTEGLGDGTAELVKFYVTPSARGRGIGKKLIEKSIDSAKELGYKELYLESMPQFSNALNLYERLGFKILKKPLGNSGHTACSIWMHLFLDKIV